MTPTSVYRYYDAFDFLIYVGITHRGVERNREHNKDKPWWQYVTRQEVDHLPDRPTALEREAGLIHTFSPPFNSQHNANAEASLTAYLALRERLDNAEDHDTLARRLRGHLPGFYTGSGVVIDVEYANLTRRLAMPEKGSIRMSVQPGTVVGRVVNVERHGAFGFIVCQAVSGKVKPCPVDVRFKTIIRKERYGGTEYVVAGVTVFDGT